MKKAKRGPPRQVPKCRAYCKHTRDLHSHFWSLDCPSNIPHSRLWSCEHSLFGQLASVILHVWSIAERRNLVGSVAPPVIHTSTSFGCSIMGWSWASLGRRWHNHRKTLMSTFACFRGKAFLSKQHKAPLSKTRKRLCLSLHSSQTAHEPC